MNVFVKNSGCSANLADGEALSGCLAKAGYKIANSVSEADVIIYNTCAVKGPTENRSVATLKRAPKGKKVVVAGCLPLINFERLRQEVRFDAAVGPAAGNKIIDIVSRVLGGERVIALEGSLTTKPGLSLPQLRTNPVISVVPVSYGCLGSCAYCCVVAARGRLRSYTVAEIAKRVKKDLAAGINEFWVTSQDMASYGKDIDTNLAVLLKTLDGLEGGFRVRVGMMTPNLVKELLDNLLEAFGSSKVFKFVHLPVQSGDDKILRRMQRNYTVEDFREIVDAFRTVFPEITIATDVICGFPGETKEALTNTLKLITKIKPDIVNVSKFFARPGTAAFEMSDTVEPAEIKRRSAEVARLVKQVSLERNKRWVGWIGEVFVDEKGKVPGSWISRNFAYKPVVVKSSENLLGKTLRVRIVKAFSSHLAGIVK